MHRLEEHERIFIVAETHYATILYLCRQAVAARCVAPDEGRDLAPFFWLLVRALQFVDRDGAVIVDRHLDFAQQIEEREKGGMRAASESVATSHELRMLFGGLRVHRAFRKRSGKVAVAEFLEERRADRAAAPSLPRLLTEMYKPTPSSGKRLSSV